MAKQNKPQPEPQPQPSAPAPQPVTPEHLPHLFKWRDWAVAFAAFLIAGARFFYDMSPEVTLQDSGELVTGAFNLGVPHPPGYPLWALLGWIWSHAIVPFGNPAWRICLMSVLTGALVVGVLTLLMSRSIMTLLRSLTWADEIADDLKHWIALSVGAAVSLTFGFNRGVWLWACVPEMRVLNVFMFILTAVTFFAWMLRPQRLGFLYLTVLVYGLGISNHQTIMVMVVPFVVGAVALEFLDAWAEKKGQEFRDAAIQAAKQDWLPVVGGFATLVLLLQMGVAGPATNVLIGQVVKVAVAWWAVSFGLGLLTRVSRYKVLSELAVAIMLSAAAWAFVMSWAGMRMLKEFMPVPLLGTLPLQTLAVLMTVFGLWYLGYAWWRKLVQWHRALICAAVFLVGVGFYAYMPISSATNPPMNWGYTRTPQGFLHHITRGQYERLHIASPWSPEFRIQINLFMTALFKQYSLILDTEGAGGGITSLAKSASNIFNVLLLGLVSLGLPALGFRDLRHRGRAWLIFVWVAFLTSSIGLLFIINPGLDRQNQEINLKFFAPAHGFFSMMLGYRLAFAIAAIAVRWKQLPRLAFYIAGVSLFLLPLIPFNRNWAICEQRGHDFGYQFGYRMFYPGGEYPPMDKDAVLYGGTYPGRFVPTYMIFGESRVPSKHRFADSHFDPEGGKNFDRSDVYIITQNALADSTYMSYIRDHYDYSRPDWNNPVTLTNRHAWQNRQLGWVWDALDRKNMYPRDPIWIPGEQDVQRAFQEYVMGLRTRQPSPEEMVEVVDGRVSVKGVAGVMNINGILTKWIFDRNKDKHSFYVEESYVIPWMYPYLEPAGIIMKINKEPLPSPQENPALWGMIIQRDRAYWDRLEREFMARPVFKRDSDAQKTFSKLRSAIGGLYASRRLANEAEYAFKQAQRLCAESPEASFRCAQLYMELNRVDYAIATLESLEKLDPLNVKIKEARRQLQATKKAREDIAAFEAAYRAEPRNVQRLLQLAQTYARAGALDRITPLCDNYLTQPGLTGQELTLVAQAYLQVGQVDRALSTLQRVIAENPRDAQAYFGVAIIRANQGNANEALDALEKACQFAPNLRDQARNDPRLTPLRFNTRFQQIVGTPAAPRLF